MGGCLGHRLANNISRNNNNDNNNNDNNNNDNNNNDNNTINSNKKLNELNMKGKLKVCSVSLNWGRWSRWVGLSRLEHLSK